MRLLHLLVLLAFSFTFSRSENCTEETCLLPSCQCPVSNGNPTSLNLTDIPQFILLTFTGNLNKNTLDPIRLILNTSHQNPNKCPISSTFFVHDVHTDYCLVQRLFDNQNEIAVTAANNKCPLTNCYNEYRWNRWTTDDWKQEINQQRLNLVERAQLHQSHLKGFRVPHLQIDRNKHLDYLQQFHFHYDSSMIFKSSNLIWPFTLNYPFNHSDCVNCDQWTKPYDALWQFPLHEWSYPNRNASCRTLFDSSCLPTDQVHSAELLFQFLIYNFERHASLSTGHRSPFLIELDLSWLSQPKSTHLQALLRFIEFILNSPTHRYVYFVSIERALEWLKYPRTLHDLRDFWAFKCTGRIHAYEADCSDPPSEEEEKLANAEKLRSSNKTNTSQSASIDRQTEKLFPSNIVLHGLWICVLLILSILFYDKYLTSK